MGFIDNIKGKKDFIAENEQVIQGMKRFFFNIPSIVDIFNKFGNLIWSNKMGQDYWGDDADLKIGTFNILALYSGSDYDFASDFNKALLGHSTSSEGVSYHFPKGSENSKRHHMETIFSPVFSHDGEVSHVVALSTLTVIQPDISQPVLRRENSKELNETNAFLRNISHELRTPLNWIIGFSDLIKSERDVMKIKAYNDHINKGGKLMLSSIEMLIDISMLEKEEISIIKKSFSIPSALEDIQILMQDEIHTENNETTIRIKNYLQPKNENFSIVSDEDKLKKVLKSLIQNSIKFTQEGFIEIGCLAVKDNYIMFYVKDSGIGISDDIREYINEIFNRKDEDISTVLTGKGLGLSIVKRYVNTLGGNIWLDSETKKGTTFFFTIKDHDSINNFSVNEEDFVRNIHMQIQNKS